MKKIRNTDFSSNCVPDVTAGGLICVVTAEGKCMRTGGGLKTRPSPTEDEYEKGKAEIPRGWSLPHHVLGVSLTSQSSSVRRQYRFT